MKTEKDARTVDGDMSTRKTENESSSNSQAQDVVNEVEIDFFEKHSAGGITVVTDLIGYMGRFKNSNSGGFNIKQSMGNPMRLGAIYCHDDGRIVYKSENQWFNANDEICKYINEHFRFRECSRKFYFSIQDDRN